MQILFDCPKCLKSANSDVNASEQVVTCSACKWERPIPEGELVAGAPTRCLVCGCSDLWKQKDFSQALGVSIVALGIVLSTVAMAYMQPELSIGILMVFAAADMVLYALMRDRLVCYRCHAIYRGADFQKIGTFDLEVNERYRQEAIRLKQANEAPSTP